MRARQCAMLRRAQCKDPKRGMRSIPPDLAQSALDAAPDAMLIIDGEGCILYANRQMPALFGYAHHEIVGQSVEKLLPARFRSKHVGHRDRYMAAAHMRPMGAGLDLYAERQDGSEFPVEISLSPIEDKSRTLIAAAIRDVTRRKQAEAELIEAREAAERAEGAAVAARNIADRANQGKSRFLATASHDLRQPLQSLGLLNRTLRALVSNPRAFEALTQQEQTIAAMSRLLNTLLDISKLESGAIKPEPVDFAIAPLFEQLRREFSALAHDKGLELKVEAGNECVHSDPSLVEEILRNLISNAIKYTRRGSVLLQCRREAEQVCVQVIDTGVGIPADQIPYIFDEFYQVGVPANSSREGYGLGLSIVQRIAVLLGLELEVRSEQGKGSAFSFTLPSVVVGQQELPDTGREAAAAPEGQIRGAHILLVEDEAAVRNATLLLLSVEGYSVEAVSSLDEALKAAVNGEKIDLLITDYHLRNGETGLSVIAALRETVGRPLKALLVTGDTSMGVRRLSQDSNLRIVSKPVNANEMLNLIASLLAS
jgi:two-component system, sensor histidine kinase